VNVLITLVLAPTTVELVSLSSQVCKSDCLPQNDVYMIAVNSVSNNTVSAHVFGNDISFLVDTGVAMSLISSDIWDRIKPSSAPAVNPVSLRLVGVDGAPLQIQGSVTINQG